VTLQEAIDDFLLARRADGLAEKTLTWYASLLRTFMHALPSGAKLADLTPRRVRQYIVSLSDQYSEESRYAHVRALHTFWRWCAAEYSITNPMVNIKYPKQPGAKLPRRAASDDIARVFASLTGSGAQEVRDRALLAFMVDTGARAGGVVRLRLVDLDLGQRRAYVREKGAKWRPVFFGVETSALLAAWLLMHDGRAETVFYNIRRGTPLTPNGLLQLCYRLGRDAGVSGNFHPHALRHHFAEALLTHGADSGILAQILGHADVDTTIRQYGMLGGAALADQHEQHRAKVKRLIPRC